MLSDYEQWLINSDQLPFVSSKLAQNLPMILPFLSWVKSLRVISISPIQKVPTRATRVYPQPHFSTTSFHTYTVGCRTTQLNTLFPCTHLCLCLCSDYHPWQSVLLSHHTELEKTDCSLLFVTFHLTSGIPWSFLVSFSYQLIPFVLLCQLILLMLTPKCWKSQALTNHTTYR